MRRIFGCHPYERVSTSNNNSTHKHQEREGERETQTRFPGNANDAMPSVDKNALEQQIHHQKRKKKREGEEKYSIIVSNTTQKGRGRRNNNNTLLTQREFFKKCWPDKGARPAAKRHKRAEERIIYLRGRASSSRYKHRLCRWPSEHAYLACHQVRPHRRRSATWATG